jgi:nucleotide-binding universal stress UspA family protein
MEPAHSSVSTFFGEITMLHLRTILHPTDLTAPSMNALHLAYSLARDHEARLIILHVTEPPPAGMMPRRKPSPQYFKERRRELRREIPPVDDVVTKYVVRQGVAEEAILEVAQHWDVDLVVMGTHGRTGLKHLFVGSVAEKVVRKANCPVLTVKLPFVEKVDAVPAGTNGSSKKRVDTAVRNSDQPERDVGGPAPKRLSPS